MNMWQYEFILHSRYGHIHKLIKMFNQSYNKRKKFFIKLTAVFFFFFLHDVPQETKHFHLCASPTTFNQRSTSNFGTSLCLAFFRSKKRKKKKLGKYEQNSTNEMFLHDIMKLK